MGHDFLERELNIKPPKIAWQVDAFGHSASSNRLFAEMGYEAIFFSRMNETLKGELRKKKQMQFIWSPEFESSEGTSHRNSKQGVFT